MRVKLFQKHVTNYLSAYCHNELTAAAAQQVQRHLASCGRCQKEYEASKVGIELAEQLQVGVAPRSLWVGVSARLDAAPTRLGPIWKYALTATAIIVIGLGGWWGVTRKQGKLGPVIEQSNPAPVWEVAKVTGAPRIGDVKIKDTGTLGIGEWLETDNASSAQLKVAEIGYVEIDPNSRVQLVQTKETEHRISLAQGKMSALILAPPRLFIVDTPSATAVDLGCAYTLEVDEAGASLLHVTSGWVSLVRDGRESFIPAGAMCATRQGRGLGTPYFADSSALFKAALHSLDFEEHAKVGQLLDSLLAEARKQDALTLWHLLGRQLQDQTIKARGRIYDRLAQLVPPPIGVTRSGILSSNQKMLNSWWEKKIR